MLCGDDFIEFNFQFGARVGEEVIQVFKMVEAQELHPRPLQQGLGFRAGVAGEPVRELRVERIGIGAAKSGAAERL